VPLKRCFPAIAAVLLLVSTCAHAEELLIGAGPRRRPLFVELYRQSLYASARYARGFRTYDAELSPQATAALTVEFHDEGSLLHVALSRGGKVLASGVADFPPADWDVAAELARSRALAAELLAAVPGAPPEPARIGTDLARARLAYVVFDFPSLVWAVDSLGDAQRGRAGDPEALKLMSLSYAWLGRWLEDLPSDRAKTFEARALALASLSAGSAGAADSELSLALALCGRQADALAVLQRGPPDSPEIAALASSLSRRDVQRLLPLAKSSRQWGWALALNAMSLGLTRGALPVLERLARTAPADFPAMHFLSQFLDVSDNHSLTQAYAALPRRLLSQGDFLAGRREGGEKPDAAAAPLDARGFIDGVRRAAGDPAEEIPAEARAGLLLDAAVDAELARMHFTVVQLSAPGTARSLAAAARPLSEAHPWGFLIPLIREGLDKDPEAAGELDAGLAKAPLNFGGVRALERDFEGVYNFNFSAWLATRDAELDDLSREDFVRGYEPNSAVGLARVGALDPFNSAPYEWGDEALADLGLERLGDRPPLLKKKFEFALKRRPRDLAAIGSLADRILRFDPEDWEARRTKAALLVAGGKPLDAAASWREAVRDAPSSLLAANAAAQMAWACSVAGDYARARRIALAAAPAYSKSTLLALAHAYEEAGRYDLAEKFYVAAESRYGKPWKQPLLGQFYMRTGDPRGWGLVHAQIPKFFAHQQESGIVLTDEDHIELLNAFLMTEEWHNAADLLARVLVPRWHPYESRYYLWLAVAILNSEGGTVEDAKAQLEPNRVRIPNDDALLPVYDAFLGVKTGEEAAEQLDFHPEELSLSSYLLAQYYTRAHPSPEKAQRLLKTVVALKRYDAPEYYLAKKQLGRIPIYSERIWRQLFAQLADVGELGERASRWWAAENSAGKNGTPRRSRR
jgi:hypothetical protein